MLQVAGLLKKPDWKEEDLKPLTRQLQKEAKQLVESSMSPSTTASSARDVLLRFLCEYPSILQGSRGAEARQICEEFETWFVEIDPHAAGWQPGEEDVDGRPLPIVTHSYSMAKYTLTNELFQLFEGSLAARAANRGDLKLAQRVGYVTRNRAPVVMITWYDAWACAVWYGSELPHSEEWKYACRAGSRERYSVGDGKTLTKEDARFGLDWNALPIEVDGFERGNAWGLYQMHGNVRELCANWCDTEESTRWARGGDFKSDPSSCRSYMGAKYLPELSSMSRGVRLSRAFGPGSTSKQARQC